MSLQTEYRNMRRSRGEGYRPRTRHLDARGQPVYTNRLFLQSSPYLLQHAHNPVDWHPWGDEPFDMARRLDRPVLTCCCATIGAPATKKAWRWRF
jgi:hypothetical protein